MVSMLRDRTTAFIALSLVLVCSFTLSAQVLNGTVSGTAADQQGAVIKGAEVKATGVTTGATTKAVTDSSGLFRLVLPPGEYKVEVTAQGFSTAVESKVMVVAGRDTGMGLLKLQVGQASTTVEVTAAAPLIEPTQSQVTNTFGTVPLATFAGIQENQGLDSLALFVPGVAPSRDNNFSNANGPAGSVFGSGFVANGLRGRNNDQQVDGQNNNDNSVAGPSLFVTDPNFVNQYVLITNQFGPEYGRNAGSVVNIVTQAGTNNWHGNIYGSYNNSVFNSMTNFQKNFDSDVNGNPLTQPPHLSNEFAGGTVGGRIVRNKWWLFGGFNQNIIGQKTVFSTNNITPTPVGLATLAACFPGGNGQAAVQALTKFGPFGISGGDPFATNPVTGVVTGCPAAEFGGVTRVLPTNSHAYNWIARSDVNLGSDSIVGRYLFNKTTTFNNELNTDAGAQGYVVNVPALSQAALLAWTHNIGSKMVNELRGSYGRLNVDFGGNTIGNTVPEAQNLPNAVTNVLFNSPTLLGFGPSTIFPQSRIVNTWQVQDNWNYVRGKHQLKAGVNWTYQQSPNVFLPNINGQFRFATWDQFFTNTPNRVRIANGPSGFGFKEYDTFVYIGDDWKATRNLTLNIGLTWSYYGQPANLFNDITTTRESNPATAFWNTSLPLSVRTFPRFPAPTNSFGPGLGFAWSPQGGGMLTGGGRTVIRGGYRMLYDPPFYNVYANMATSAPEVFLQTFTGATAGLLPLPATPTGPFVRTLLGPAITPGVFDPRTQAETTISPNFEADRVQTWLLGLEREVSKNAAFEIRYVGNAARRLFQSINSNPFATDLLASFPQFVPPGVVPCPTTQQVLVGPQQPTDVGRQFCGTGVQRMRTNGGFSNYNGLQTEFRANNLFNQLTFRAAYTYSKTLDNVSEIFGTAAAGNSVAFSQNPFQPGGSEYSFSGLDFPNQFSVTFFEAIPFMKEQHGWGHLLGGWSFSANFLYGSGQRYTPSQLGTAIFSSPGDFYDANFLGTFAGTDSARPFFANKQAPVSSVGIFAADACAFFASTGSEPICNPAIANQLISLNALNLSGAGLSGPPVPVNVTDVHFVTNGGIAQSVFGTPFGNVARNIAQDATTNLTNMALYKNFKFSERASLQLNFTALNVFNQANFLSVDPFLEDAGAFSPFTGFANNAVTNSQPRQLFFGGKITW
ncbi:MAG TPA: TonB-dependent receptor [Candidatus Angelobacter sp.]